MSNHLSVSKEKKGATLNLLRDVKNQVISRFLHPWLLAAEIQNLASQLNSKKQQALNLLSSCTINFTFW